MKERRNYSSFFQNYYEILQNSTERKEKEGQEWVKGDGLPVRGDARLPEDEDPGGQQLRGRGRPDRGQRRLRVRQGVRHVRPQGQVQARGRQEQVDPAAHQVRRTF